MKSKKYYYTGDQVWDNQEEVDASTLAQEILADPELADLDEVIIGLWGESYDNSVQPIIDAIIDHKEKFQHITSLFVGDMDYEECEVSWIEQGDYSRLWQALPDLEELTIKGSNGLDLGQIHHDHLQVLNIICGGLPAKVIGQIAQAQLPNLVGLNLYLGVEDYGFDGGLEDVRRLIQADFIRNLKYLGLGDSELQDEIVALVLDSLDLSQLETLDFSNGTLTDKGGRVLLDNVDKLRHLQSIDLSYHYLSDDMMKALQATGLPFILDEQNEIEVDEDDGELYLFPMLTE